jgi:ABC-type sugar transport systems, permease components
MTTTLGKLKDGKKSTYRLSRRENMGMLYILPWLVGFLVFGCYPFFASIVYSFTDYTLLKKPDFVGFQNYVTMFTTDRDFYKSLGVTIVYSLVAVPCKLIFALFIALLLNMKLRAVNFFRTVYYIPSILGGSVAIAIVWKSLFANNGAVNLFLNILGISSVQWMGTPVAANSVIIMLNVWQFGSSMIIFLAGLKQIPQELYDVAKVDGSNKVHIFFNITIPLLTPVIFFNLVMQVINSLQEFSAPFLITNGAPMKYTYFFGMKLYEYGFKYFKMGYSCALSWVLFAIILVLTALIFKNSKRWVYYEDGGK